MKKALTNIFALILVAVAIYFFRGQFGKAWLFIESSFFPCSSPITYSISDFDERFGITKQEFVSSLAKAEKIWEEIAGKDLFSYIENNGEMSVSLVYDSRQEVTETLSRLGLSVDNTKASYDKLKSTYENLVADFDLKNEIFESRYDEFIRRKNAYERTSKGSRKNQQVNESERLWLNNEADALNRLQEELNGKVDDINMLAGSLNDLAKKLNINVSSYNEIAKNNSGEFEEGVYRYVDGKREIEIYQFKDINMLVRVLAHEFGHSLSMEHIDDEEAIMYYLNNSESLVPSTGDKNLLKNVCKLK